MKNIENMLRSAEARKDTSAIETAQSLQSSPFRASGSRAESEFAPWDD